MCHGICQFYRASRRAWQCQPVDRVLASDSMPLSRRGARRVAPRTAAWLICALSLIPLFAIPRNRAIAARQEKPAGAAASGADAARATCGGCHALPPPEILPRGAWRDEFVRMMFIRDNRLPP